MGYLIKPDFKRLIQSENLTQILGADDTLLAAAIETAAQEAISYLRQKFITTREFASVTVFDYTKTYEVFDRVYLDATAHSASATYATNALVLHSGSVYRAKANNGPAAFSTNNFTLLGAQYDIFYVHLPLDAQDAEIPEFSYTSAYAAGDEVFWRGKKYICAIATGVISHDVALQSRTVAGLPLPNVFPDDPVNGPKYWGAGTTYNAPSKWVTDTDYWTAGDNRSAQMVQYTIDIALYHLHSRIAPRNIPDLRVKRYDDAITWLRRAAKGEITPNLPGIQPRSGGTIRYGGNTKLINSY